MRLPCQVVESSSGEYRRNVWFLLPPRESPEKLAVVLDAEFYLDGMKVPSGLLNLQKRRAIPQTLFAFVSYSEHDLRPRDLTCNSRYAEFIAVDLLRLLHEKFPTIPQSGHLIAGPSLGGLAATHLSLARPELFPMCLSQSGSFWWNDEWLLKNLPAHSSPQKFWLSVGNQETESGVTHKEVNLRQEASQVDANQHLADALSARGDTVHHHIYKGGHATKPWKKELPQALTWLFS